jgi:site-specific DNA-cytosine methylase
MRVVGVLAGVGSLLREAQDVGFEVVGNLEPRAPYSTGRHLGWDLNFSVPLIRKPEQVDQMRNWYRPDLVIGHPPCGAHSQLGNSGQPAHKTTEERRAMQAVRHARAGELPLFVQQVALIKPKVFVLDNLPKILSTVAPREWWESALPRYDLQFITMMNWDYGIPQLRKRLWVVGTRKPRPPFRFKPTKKRLAGPRTAMEAWEGLSWKPWENDKSIGHVHVDPDKMLTGDYRTTVEGLNVKMASQLALGFLSIPPDKAWPYITRFGRLAVKIGRQRLAYEKYSRTITGLPSIHHPMTGWPLTARERARLMGWPDDFHLGGPDAEYNRTELMRLTLFTGKAVPSGFPKYLLKQIVTYLEKHG